MSDWEVQRELARDGERLRLRLTALEAAGDALAHALLYREHPELLARWWQERGGHDACTICRQSLP